MNIFIFNKSLRLIDNTTLIHQMREYGSIVPIFIFTEQVNLNKNKYASNNSIQFMVESLIELYDEINKYNGKLYLFNNDNFIKVLKEIQNVHNINSIGMNIDYSPYARNRELLLKNFCDHNNIKLIMDEDHVLYNILDGSTLKKDKTPYTIFTPFRNFCMKNLSVRKPNKFNNFDFYKFNKLSLLSSCINIKDIHKFYEYNKYSHVTGGRSYALNILKNATKFNDYEKNRDFLTYKTTYLAAYNHFGNISIREVYYAFIQNKGIINELHWRDFYYNLFYNFPHMLEGQLNGINKSFKSKFDNIKWNYNKKLFKKWCDGKLGIPICDAGMRQLNLTGFQHNRLRMICSSVLSKLLLIPWHWGEKYFAQKLTDYDCIQNGGGWGWGCHGIDPNQVFRIFSPKLQSEKFDPDTVFIKQYIPELINIPSKDIHNWESEYINYKNIYYKPAINYKESRKKSLEELYRVNKIK